MHIDTDSSDTPTLTHESCLKKSLTNVSLRTDALKCQRSVSKVSRVLSVKCQCVESSVLGVKVSEKKIRESKGK